MLSPPCACHQKPLGLACQRRRIEIGLRDIDEGDPPLAIPALQAAYRRDAKGAKSVEVQRQRGRGRHGGFLSPVSRGGQATHCLRRRM
jgi:hypothetical protein